MKMNKSTLSIVYQLLQKAAQCNKPLAMLGWISAAMDIIEKELKNNS